jgi:Carbohydrate-selective porin, OprB family/S-layer homology domain
MSRVIKNSLWLAPALVGAAALSAIASVPQTVEATSLQKEGLVQVQAVEASEAPVLVAQVPVQQTAPVNVSQPSAMDQLATYGAEGGRGNSMSQVTSVSQLTDVKPTDWAFQALQSLVERYGCIVGYPDKTYRGNRALTRYEFAAGLNACLDKIQELIAAATADFVKKEDLETVKRLQEEFAAELATLRGRVTALEVRSGTLEKQQFSTTTKLAGEVIFSVADTFGDRATRNGSGGLLGGIGSNFTNAAGTIPRVETNTTRNAAGAETAGLRPERQAQKDDTETMFSDRVRLSLRTSFTGKDLLLTRLNAANTTLFNNRGLANGIDAQGRSLTPEAFRNDLTGTAMTRLAYDGGVNNTVEVDKLYYRFPLGDKLRIHIDAVNSEYYDGLVSSLSPFESSGQGAVSRFGRFNPIFRANNPGLPGSFGASFDFKLSDALNLQGAFTGDRNSNDPGAKNGLFNGGFTALGQVVFRPSRTIDVGLTYVRGYYPGGDAGLTGGTGSAYANNPFATTGTLGAITNQGTSSDNFGLQLQWRFSPKFTVGGWAGYTRAHAKANSDEATIWNWAVFAALPDFGKKGNLLGLLVGMPPKVTDNDFTQTVRLNNGLTAIRRREDNDTTIHVEGLYRYRINDNISITPGVIVIFNPEQNNANATQFVGVLRTTFTF